MNSNSPDPFHGLNPADLMAAAAMPTDDGADTIPLQRADLPSLAEIAAAFPDLEILGLIGHGGMSAVFRAKQPKLDRVVALKVLPKSLAATPGFAERFNREGRVLARLSHPNIVAVHDFGESGGFCYLLMEYVDGVNLRQAMRAGRFTPEQALNIIPAICDALQFAHTQGVLHRDIKPENILLDSKGKVKIADFGIAKILDEKGGDAMLLTQSGARLGTAPYMAPEQIEQPSSVDHRADIYSLGVVFYEMLTGELPLGRFAPPSEKSTVSGNIDEIVFRALEKERGRRQQSVGEFKTQIEGLASMPPAMQKELARRFEGFEYKSKRTLFGMPLVHVTQGIDPTTGRKRVARGFIAFGETAIGVIAFGGYARGFVACGGMAVGCLSCGGLSVGLISVGGLALALLFAFGGISLGAVASGGMAMGWYASGGMAAGVHAYGGAVYALVSGMGGKVHAPLVIKSLAEMPPVLQWLAGLMTRSVGVMAWLWLPMVMPSTLVPWWARKQSEFDAQGAPDRATAWHERPSRVFWLIPATILGFLSLVWMTNYWTNAGSVGMTAQTFTASAVTCIGLVLAAMSLPLWLRLVPMNQFYGVCLPSTFASEKHWLTVNAQFGKHLFLWTLAIIGAGIAGFYQLLRHHDAYAWAAITLILVGAASSVVSSLWWMRQHPADKPARPRNRLASWSGQIIVGVVIAMFIKSFIAGAYKIPQGNEPGVAKDSHWLASHLDTGFETGDLIIFEHESSQYWIARVIKREAKGLLLKRGGSPEEFFMPWDKIVGKMLFSHFSPDALNAASSVKPVSTPPKTEASITEGTSQALEQPPVLRFTRLKLNATEWRWPVYAPDGSTIDNAISQPLINASSQTESEGPDAAVCRWQLWFEHPDFDRRSMISVGLTALDGSELPELDGDIAGPGIDEDHPPLCCVVVSPGKKGRLPAAVRMVLRYSIGPWRTGSTVATAFHGGMAFGSGHLAGIGEGQDQRAFLSWAKKADDSQPDVIARLRTGPWIEWKRSLMTGGEGQLIHQFTFGARLADLELFRTRSRTVRAVVFDKVVVPPLPDDENAWVTVEGGVGKPGQVRWQAGLTVMKAVVIRGGITWTAPKVFSLMRDGKTENFSIKLATDMETKPGDKIIFPE